MIPRYIVNDQIDAALAECVNRILGAIEHDVTAQFLHGLDLVMAGHGDDPGAAPPGKLDGR